jgi:CBS domain-containing protein
MKLADVLTEGHIRVGLAASTLDEAASLLIRALGTKSGLPSDDADSLVDQLVAGTNGTVVRANEDVLLAAIEHADAHEAVAALGVFPKGFPAPGAREGSKPAAKVLLLIVTRMRVQSLRAEAFPRLARAFRATNVTKRVLAAPIPSAVLEVEQLLETDLLGALRVADAMSPVSLRIYPDTPLPEVLDLMARKGVHSLPVVGAEYQVLGLISRSDALGQMVQRIGAMEGEGDEEEPVLARDIMSRSVLCVEEDQTLLEAARLMVTKSFERLPVVRSGELVGFVTEETALRMLGTGLE